MIFFDFFLILGEGEEEKGAIHADDDGAERQLAASHGGGPHSPGRASNLHGSLVVGGEVAETSVN